MLKKEQVTVFATVIKGVDKEFILGRIAGMLAAFTDDHYAMIKVKYNDKPAMLVRTRGTLTNYKKAQAVIEKCYPQKCEFDVDVYQFIKEES